MSRLVLNVTSLYMYTFLWKSYHFLINNIRHADFRSACKETMEREQKFATDCFTKK